MLKKIHLFHQIRKFYKTFGEVVNSNFITKLSDITEDNLFDVLFDINEVLDANSQCFYEEAYAMDAWLNKLQAKITAYREKPQHNNTITITTCLVVIALVCGYTIGRQHTIRQAELHSIAEDGYHINFGDEVHSYTFEEER